MIELSHTNSEIYQKIVLENRQQYLDKKCANFSDLIIKDPDLVISQEIHIVDGNYVFSPDGICGHKYLEKYWENTKTIADAYEVIRGKIILWPKHRESINVKRYRKYRDRIDFTIFDLLSFFYYKPSDTIYKEPCTLIKAGTTTADLFAMLKKEDKTAQKFIKEFCLEPFVLFDKDIEKYRVFNLQYPVFKASEDIYDNNSFINSIAEYHFNQDINKEYLNNLYILLNNLKMMNNND